MTISNKLKREINGVTTLLSYFHNNTDIIVPDLSLEFIEFVDTDRYNWNLDTRDCVRLIEKVELNVNEMSTKDQGWQQDIHTLKNQIRMILNVMHANPPAQDRAIFQ
jgi:hypothetical protein|tara:strand:- start:204 stop:524 length:321 start_codon:yes stop_codon:yes gene_type:complete